MQTFFFFLGIYDFHGSHCKKVKSVRNQRKLKIGMLPPNLSKKIIVSIQEKKEFLKFHL